MKDLPLEFLLAEANRLLRQRVERDAAAALGLSVSEARTFAYVVAYAGSKQTDLATVMGVDPMTLVTHVDALEAKGLVERRRDPADRRAKIIRPSERAAMTANWVIGAGQSACAVAFRGSSVGDFLALRSALQGAIENLTAPIVQPEARP